MTLVQRLKHVGLNLGASDEKTDLAAESPMFGFWLFLMSDAVLFTLLFAVYGTMMHAQAGGPGPHQSFDIKSVFAETVLLLLSSFTFGMASLSMKYRADDKRHLVGWLLVTLVLGLGFVGLEIHDFVDMAAKGALPERSGWLSAFFTLVPTHGLHVTCGCVWIIIMLIQIGVFGLDSVVKTRIMRLALFWHFLDIVWVGIFSVVYLQGLM